MSKQYEEALELSISIMKVFKEDTDAYTALAALKACMSVIENNIQSEASKEIMRRTIAQMTGTSGLNS